MEIIPVIDIRKNQVVYAVAGQRQHYQPLKTPLSRSNSAKDIVQTFVYDYAFETIYIADIDAIEGRGNNNHVIGQLAQSFPSLIFWVDQGISSAQGILSAQKVCNPAIIRHVIGSETNVSANELDNIVKLMPNVILSLDFKNNLFQGDQSVLQNTSVWPEKIIVMHLTCIASNEGPDYKLILHLKNLSEEKQIYVAGGVRHEADLQSLYNIGISGAVIATALHTQQLLPENLSQFHKKNSP